jgi:hypothetical protein
VLDLKIFSAWLRRCLCISAEISQGAGAGESLPEWNQSNSWKELKFGHGGGGRSARDSRYWDRDDRRRDEDYTEDEKEKISGGSGTAADASGSGDKGVTAEAGVEDKGLTLETGGGAKDVPDVSEGGKGGTLYNEGGRKELEQYEAAAMGATGTGVKEVDPDDEYDDGIDSQDDFEDAHLHPSDGGRKLGDGGHESAEKKEDVAIERHTETGAGVVDSHDVSSMDKKKASGSSDKKHGSKKKSKHKKSGELFPSLKFKCYSSTIAISEHDVIVLLVRHYYSNEALA